MQEIREDEKSLVQELGETDMVLEAKLMAMMDAQARKGALADLEQEQLASYITFHNSKHFKFATCVREGDLVAKKVNRDLI